MFTATIRRQIATIVCTVLMSSACVLSAVGPAQSGGSAPTITQTVA